MNDAVFLVSLIYLHFAPIQRIIVNRAQKDAHANEGDHEPES